MTKNVVGAVVVCVLLGSLGVLFWALSNNKVVIGYNKGYMPDQPINFPHTVHAGTYGIDCRYCHSGVEVSRHSSVPPLGTCMNCHGPALVQKDTPELAKVREAYQNNTPIAWNKVNLLPDHVKFQHAPHIKAGKDCATCHGPVAEMPKVYQYQSLSMGFCVNCHRQPENHARRDCGTCHY